jgi:tetratricopeptide (TPR) repeat protein
MKTKTRKLWSETKSHSGRFACLLLLSCIVLSMSSEIGADNDTRQNTPFTAGSKSQQSSSGYGQRTDSAIIQKLWQSRLSVPDGERDEKYSIELQRLIEKIRSVKFEQARLTSEPFVALEPVPAAEPEQISLPEDVPQEPVKEQIDDQAIEVERVTNLPYKPIAEDTLLMLEKTSQNPSQLYDPLALGEVLFLSGHLKKAAKLYQQAFERMERDEVASNQDKAWTLFQTGNCLRYDDLISAKQIYEQLLVEYPDSPWSDLVKARIRLIDWYLQVKPKSLVAEQGS